MTTSENPQPSRSEPTLERRLGAWDATLITIGSVIGTGIFITSADIARVLPDGRLLMLVWVVGGLLSLAGALTYAELGVLYPDAGGMYTYLKEAYGPLPGFLYGWVCFLVIFSGGIAALAVAFGVYLGSFFGYFAVDNVIASVPVGGWTWTFSGAQLAAVAAILALTAINYLGVREGASVQNVLTVIKIGAIIAFCVFGLAVAAPEMVSAAGRTAPPSLPTGLLAAFGIGMIAALWTYDGWYGATFSAGEMRRPERQLPIGLILGTAVIMLLYLALNAVYLKALSLEEMAATPRIGETAAAALFGPLGARAIAAAVVISTLGCLSATILYSSRVYQPMARDGVFFRALARVHPRYRTPGRSLWAQSLWAVVLAASGTYEQIYTYVVFAAVLFHAATGGAVFVLRRKRPDAPRPYRVWGYPVVPILFIGASGVLVVNTLWEKPVESLSGLGFLVLGLPAYLWWRKRHRARALGVALALAALPLAARGAEPPPRPIALQADRLIDGVSGEVRTAAAMVVEGERIVAVGGREIVPPGAEVIAFGDATILPGLIDAHSHPLIRADTYQLDTLRESSAFRALHGLRAVQENLRAGWTTLRIAGDADTFYAHLDVRRAIDQGIFVGPRLTGAGHYISVTGGGGDLNFLSPEQHVIADGLVVDGVEGMRGAVRREIKYGSDWIKILVTGAFASAGDDPRDVHVSAEELRAVVEEAARRKVPVMAHAHATEGIKLAVRAGVRSIEHGTFIDSEGIDLMLERGTFLVPTLYIGDYFIEHGSPSGAQQKLVDLSIRYREENYRRISEAIRRGVKVAVGSDFGGWPAHLNVRELACLIEAGMTPIQALQAATIVGAQLLGWDDRIGSLEPGKLADVLVVAGDPLADISALERPVFVMLGGKIVRRD